MGLMTWSREGQGWCRWGSLGASRVLNLIGRKHVPLHELHPSEPNLLGAGRLMRLDWIWLFQNGISTLALTLGFAFAILASLAGYPRTLRPTCLLSFGLFSLCNAVAAIGYWEQSDLLNTVLALFQMIPSIAFTMGIAFFEARVVRVLLVYSALWVCLTHPRTPTRPRTSMHPLPPSLPTSFSCRFRPTLFLAEEKSHRLGYSVEK
jgi:hypothetical protein